jgi:hypothetical protein
VREEERPGPAVGGARGREPCVCVCLSLPLFHALVCVGERGRATWSAPCVRVRVHWHEDRHGDSLTEWLSESISESISESLSEYLSESLSESLSEWHEDSFTEWRDPWEQGTPIRVSPSDASESAQGMLAGRTLGTEPNQLGSGTSTRRRASGRAARTAGAQTRSDAAEDAPPRVTPSLRHPRPDDSGFEEERAGGPDIVWAGPGCRLIRPVQSDASDLHEASDLRPADRHGRWRKRAARGRHPRADDLGRVPIDSGYSRRPRGGHTQRAMAETRRARANLPRVPSTREGYRCDRADAALALLQGSPPPPAAPYLYPVR